MSDSEAPSARPIGSDAVFVVYVLFLISLGVGVTYLVAGVIAYINRPESSGWVETHYRFQIRTFWIGLLYAVIGIITLPIAIGVVICLFTVLWLIVRCVKGILAANRREAIPDVDTWFW